MKGKYDVKEKIMAVGRRNCAISDITVAELYYGAEFSSNPEREKSVVDAFVENLTVIPTTNVSKAFGYNKAELRRRGELIDDFDLMIGTTAVVYGMIAVTENVRHLGRIPGIQIENWIER